MSRTGHRLLAAWALALSCSWCFSAPSLAQSGDVFSGKDFGGLRFQIAPQAGPFTLAAQQVYSWTEEPAGVTASGATLGGRVQRLLLQGDVRINTGIYSFGASRAVVWIEQIDTPDRGRLYQLAMYFDRLGDPKSQAGTQQSGDRLLVTAVIAAEPAISADALFNRKPSDPLVNEGEARFARFLTALASPADAGPTPLPTPPGENLGVLPRVSGIVIPGMSQPFEPGSPLARTRGIADPTAGSLADRIERTDQPTPMFSRGGFITIAAGEPVLTTDNNERILVVTGGAVVQYSDPRNGRSLQLSAQRAVIFMDPGPLEDLARSPADKVRGIYLEGDVVATDGRFNQRANQVYYDVRNNRAMLIDGVFWTYDDRRQLPLYVRAKAISQAASNEITAQGVKISASAFFEPQLSLAADQVTITREGASESRPPRTVIKGDDLTLRAGGLPFFYWPSYTGDLERFPLRDVRVETSSSSGVGLKTRWDLFGLLGVDPKDDTKLDLLLDGWIKRGAGLGLDSEWKTASLRGSAFAYLLPEDRGTDQLSSGARRDRTGQTRGIIDIENRWLINNTWSLFTEGVYISDETFVDANYTTEAETRREYVSSIALRAIEGQASFNFEGRHNFNDFTANQYLLQTPGYTVSKLPEIRYARAGDDLFATQAPGVLIWSSEYRASRMAMNFVGPTAAELGFDDPVAARAALGIAPNQSLEGALIARGFPDRNTMRADTRQELSANLKFDDINITPFIVGRATAWDKKFDTFSPTNQDNVRLWGAAGIRASTTVQRVYDSVDIQALDIHRLRHIITPSVTAWTAGANRSAFELPTFDQRVEALNEGSAVRAGLEQVFQTMRGAPGRYRSEDVLKLNTDIVWSSNDADRRTPFGRFFDDRPEYSTLGKYVTVDGAYKLTDALAITGNTIYDLDLNQQARSTIGATIEHSRDFTTFVELRYLNPLNATYLAMGADFRLTSTYTLSTQATFDTDKGRVQTVSFRLSREFPSVVLAAKVGYNDITQETTIGFALTPVGKDRRGENLVRRLGRDQIDRDLLPPGDQPTRLPLPGE
ncbi:MAG: hypothetical protein IBJ18_04225 [Phycisphaerales bacterium]|nr:hypothetical protein [Phycisphaerales bacterium]